MYGVAQSILDVPLMLLRAHVDEVDNDEAAEISDAQLPCDFVGSFKVGVVRGGFDVAAFGRACRVNVNRDHRFSVIDNDTASRGQRYVVCERGLDLRFDLEARKQWHRIDVVFELAQIVRHRLLDVLVGVLVGRLIVDQDFTNVIGEIVA